VVVLTRGMQLVLQTYHETLEYLRENGIKIYVGETFGGLFHSTSQVEIIGKRI
jgi:hypothetical protein